MADANATNENREAFVLRRELNAPRELVFEVWTDPKHVGQWFGPKGFTMHSVKLDLQPGGKFHYGLSGPNGASMWGLFVYREVVPPSRLVYVSSFADETGAVIRAPFSDQWPMEVFNTITFTEQGGKTMMEMIAVPLNATPEEAEFFVKMHGSMQMGWGGTLEQLDQYLATKG